MEKNQNEISSNHLDEKSKKYYVELPLLSELNSRFKTLAVLPPEICPQGKLKIVMVSQFTRSGFTAISVQDKMYHVVIPRRFKKNRRLHRVKIGNLTLVSQVFNGKKAILEHVYNNTANSILQNNYFSFRTNQHLFSNDF